MTDKRAVLHVMCGKIASGKSTFASQLGETPGTVLLSEDHMLARLYPGEIKTLDDYARCARRLREAVGRHIAGMLRGGIDVVLDFQANTPSARAWARQLFEAGNADHQLHYLRATDALCKQRLAQRNASGAHEYQVSDADFDLFNSHFVECAPAEKFNVIVHE